MVAVEWRPLIPLALDTVLDSFILSLDNLRGFCSPQGH